MANIDVEQVASSKSIEGKARKVVDESPEKMRADELLQAADAHELYHLYIKKLVEFDAIVASFTMLMKYRTGESDSPRYSPPMSESTIESMERVSLAVIDLCKTVASKTASD